MSLLNPRATSAFDLPARLVGKADPALIAADERHFATIAESLERSVADVAARLDQARREPVGQGQAAVERDAEIHRLAAQLRALRRHGLDLCLGHVVDATGEAAYIGRLGLLDRAGKPLLLDWRSPAAEPFFGATHANPMGLTRRRRYRWRGGPAGEAKVVDYWDEVFAGEELSGLGGVETAALDDQSAFIASLGANRSPRMRDVLGTIAADQDAIIRAGSRGALVVDGGPGTGKTVVALHRAAYLVYAEPRLRHGVLFVGPHEPYLAYVEDVLPSLGEEGVRLCTLKELVPEGATAGAEADPEVARLKSATRFEEAIEAAVRFYETPPAEGMTVETDVSEIWLGPEDWAEAFAAPEPGTPHNEAREQVREVLVDILVDKAGGGSSSLHSPSLPSSLLRELLWRNEELREVLDNAWTLIAAADLVADLWSVPAYLRECAPWLSAAEVRLLQRADPQAWTESDLPLLDAARQRLGDPGAARRRRRHIAAAAAEREQRSRVIDDLLASADYDDGEGLMAQLRQPDLQDALVDAGALFTDHAEPLAGPFAHIVVDEAQELTDAQWRMLLRRCPSGSFTIVGDRAQARRGFTETWPERLERSGMGSVRVSSLSVNYRTPAEVMAEAEPVIRAVLPDANVPTSIRAGGEPVRHGAVAELHAILGEWLIENAEGIACVIAADGFDFDAVDSCGSDSGGFDSGGSDSGGFDSCGVDSDGFDSGRLPGDGRVRVLTPELAKGLEFDLVILVDPERFGAGGIGPGGDGPGGIAPGGDGPGGVGSGDDGLGELGGQISHAVDLYVAMTRATQRLVILTSG